MSSLVVVETAARNAKYVKEHNKVTFKISVSHQPIELLSTNAGEIRTNRAATKPDIVAATGLFSLVALDILKSKIERR